MPVLKTIVGDATKQDFKDLCVKRGLSESEQLRSLVVAETQQALAQPSQGIAPIQLDGSNADLDRMTVRMPGFVMDGAKDRARNQGMAPSRWVAALVQSNLTAQPVMTDVEVEALLASNRELAAVGRNLSQVARAMNAFGHEVDRVHLEVLTELSAAVTSSRSEIRRLVRASRQAWGMDHEPD
ncbi:MAG: plasmid mobilization relaxosome protein MobC [Rhodoferax sp.]|nr:plasmid mobilization relaxosome protein MobC [Rhodoferax sp.]